MLKAQQEISYNFVMLFLSELFSQKIILENWVYLIQCDFQETWWDQQIKRFKSKQNKNLQKLWRSNAQ
jgi:hypothetical protein